MKGSGCYNCPVKGCTAEYRGSRCAHLRELDGVDFDPMAHADKIRSMSDEELLDFMIKTIGNAMLCKTLGTEPKFCTLNWLRQPIEEA